ncbi:MAG: NCS2 family permease [Coriobacteriia bacterium]|nr:NCS2 family permease [Coriobacteriia bacterium]
MDKFFKITERGSTLSTEILAGVTTFLTMAYIIFVNPAILSLDGAPIGVPYDAAFMATCVGAGLMCILMGIWANRPIALASGMGLNAIVAFTIIGGLGYDWREAMAVIFVEGVIITICVLVGLREAVFEAIPANLRRAIGVGIGLFIAFIGLKNGGLVVADEATYLTMGALTSWPVVVALVSIIVTAICMAFHIKGDILIGIIVATIVAFMTGVASLPEGIMLWPNFETAFVSFGAPFQTVDGTMALLRVFSSATLLLFVFSILMTDFFDTMGTLVAVGEEAGFVDNEGDMDDAREMLLVDSIAAAFGGLIGASSITSYIESGSGVSDGGRTGITVIVTGLLFLVAIFFLPIVGVVPAEATAGALVIVGFLMCGSMRHIDWSDFEISFPAFLTMLVIPLTYNITNGIGIGFIAFVIIKAIRGKFDEIKPFMWVVAIAFLVVFLEPIYSSWF